MKKINISPMFVMICIVSLVAAYGIGICLDEIKANKNKKAENKILSKQIQELKDANIDYETQGTALNPNPNTNARNNQFSNRNMQTDFGRGMRNFGGQDISGTTQQSRFSRDNTQNMTTEQRTQMYGNLSFRSVPGTEKAIQEPNNSEL